MAAYPGTIGAPINIRVNAGQQNNDFLFTLPPGQSKYFKSTVPKNTKMAFSFTSKDNKAKCQAFIQKQTITGIDKHYNVTLAWYNALTSRYGTARNNVFTEGAREIRTYAKMTATVQDQDIALSVSSAPSIHYIKIKNESTKVATFWVSMRKTGTGGGGEPGLPGTITNPSVIIPNSGGNSFKDTIQPGQSKYYKFTIPNSAHASFGIVSMDQKAVCNLLVEEGTTAKIDTYYANALAWYKANPADRYTLEHNIDYPPKTWARMRDTADGQAVSIDGIQPGTTYYVVVKNEGNIVGPDTMATIWVSAIMS